MRGTVAIGLIVCLGLSHPAAAQYPGRERAAGLQPAGPVLPAPEIQTNPALGQVQSAAADQSYRILPINLATALCLSQARPLVIASAQASVEKAAAQLQAANALWLPDVNIGTGYSHHDGANQETNGGMDFASFGSYNVGAGATLCLGVTDALFRPLAAQQELFARRSDLQAARNDALLAVADAYFQVQQSRGRLAGILDSAAKSEELVKQIESLAQGLVAPIEADRARVLQADLNQQAAAARAAWRIASAHLTRTLRLNPSSIVIPQEPSFLQITLISPQFTVDDLIPCGLLNRPELASQKAMVQATLELLRQEKVRPLLPSVVLEGTGPAQSINGGIFGGGKGGDLSASGGSSEVSLGLVWTLKNLGLGNKALVRGRAADNEKAVVDLFNLQDQIAEEVVHAHADVEGAAAEIPEADRAVREAVVTFNGTLQGLAQVRGAGNLLQTVSRPQEGVAALQQLNQAYERYFLAVAKYNRAQFQLYHSLGYPSRILVWDRPLGEVQAIDTSRPPAMETSPQNASRIPSYNRR